ncbi:MAG TPA: hypothetical protein VNA14_14040 [Mycobacteriales bacterium]|nr:hypothetical protein [Mycobacteriales bacterium]
MSRRTAVVPAAVLALALSGCAAENPATPTGFATPATATAAATVAAASAAPAVTAAPVDGVLTAEVAVAGGKVTRKSSTFELKRGDRARIVVTSDAADEVHLHGYDVKAAVAPGSPATLEFTATIPGQFEVELEGAGLLLLTVSVR